MRLLPILISISFSSVALGQSADIELLTFRPESRALRPGATARSELAIRNTGPTEQNLWIGYSVRDSLGTWYDVPPEAVNLPAGGESRRSLGWTIPALATPGPYRVVMAVWSARPGTATAVRLLAADRNDAFRVLADPQLLMEQPGLPWRVASHPLGRGTMQPARVFTDGSQFRLVLAANRCDGAEMRSVERVWFGSYSAKMKVPDAPGSISALFLYGEGSGDNDEIDIEIFNDGSRRALLTSWIRGRKSREAEIRLPFDPRSGFHEYAIAWMKESLEFRIDGRRVARWTRDYPTDPMRVVANVWWPVWLNCSPPSSDRELRLEAIRLRPDPAAPSRR